MLKRILTLLALLPALAYAQYSVPYNPRNVAISGGTISGVTGVTAGGTLATDAAFYVTGSPLAGIRQYGFRSNYTSTTGATTLVNGFRAQDSGAAGSYATAYYAGFEVANYTKGASQTLTAQYGITVGNLTSGTSNYGIESELTAGANKWNLYMSGTAQNAIAGNLRVGSVVVPVATLDITGTLSVSAQYNVNGVLLASATAPTVTGFGTSPSVPNNNGTSAFTVNVGTGGTANTGTVTLPAATTGWVCTAQDVTTPASFVVSQTGGTTTTATFTNYSRTTGLITAWTASDVLRVSCFAY